MMPSANWTASERGPYFLLVRWNIGDMFGERGIGVDPTDHPTVAAALVMNSACMIMFWAADYIMKSSMRYDDVRNAAKFSAESLKTAYGEDHLT